MTACQPGGRITPVLVAGTHLPMLSCRGLKGGTQMRQLAVSAVVLLAALLAACSGSGSTAQGSPASAKPAAAVTASPAPRASSPLEGTWRSGKVTEPEWVRWYKAAGGTDVLWNGRRYGSVTAAGKAFFDQLGYGARRYAVITIRFKSGYMAEFDSGDGGPAVLGDRQSYTISGGRTLALTSRIPPPCVGVYKFRVTGRRLRLHVVKQCTGPLVGPFPTTIYASFPYTKVS
jgi:hypothetical protein